MGEPTSDRARRRAAERARAGSVSTGAAAGSWWRSPIVVLSAGAGAVGILIVAVLLLVNGSGPASTGAVRTPAVPPPTELVDGRALGAPGAPVTVDVWADFQCPACEQFTTDIEPLLRASYVKAGSVRIVFHDFAFLGDESFAAAAAARVSEAIGPGFWQMHDLLYANQGAENSGAFRRDRLADLAVSLGMERAAFLKALDDPSTTAAVRTETAAGVQLGINSTPSLVIDGKLYGGVPTWEQLSPVIDALLAGASPSAVP